MKKMITALLFLWFYHPLLSQNLFIINDNINLLDKNFRKTEITLNELDEVNLIKGKCIPGKYLFVNYNNKKYFVKSDNTSCIPETWEEYNYRNVKFFLPKGNFSGSYIDPQKNEFRYENRHANIFVNINRNINENQFTYYYNDLKYLKKGGIYKRGHGGDYIVVKKTPNVYLFTHYYAELFYGAIMIIVLENNNNIRLNSFSKDKNSVSTLKKIAFSFDISEPEKIPLNSTYRVSISALRVRSASSTKSKHKFTLKKGDKVTILENTKTEILYDKNAYWVKIKTKDGRQGYVFSAFLEKVR